MIFKLKVIIRNLYMLIYISIWQKFCWKPLPLPKKMLSIYWDNVTDVNSQSEDNDVTQPARLVTKNKNMK